MLFRLSKISKLLAGIAAAGLLLIAVHGIFLHREAHAKAAETHACILCEITHFLYAFPEAERFVPDVPAPSVSHTYREKGMVLKPCHRLRLRGPPVFRVFQT